MNSTLRLASRLAPYKRSFSTLSAPDLEVDNVVIGAGVVGLALAEKLARDRPSETTVIVEKNKRVGEETSARNSEVIHAGIYYPESSLKTQLCIHGNRLLYSLLEQTSIPHQRVGKWIVAQSTEQTNYLKGMHEKAQALGVETYFLDANQAREQEPDIRAHAVLVSPSTGIIDSHSLMSYLEQSILQNGGEVGLSSPVRAIRPAVGPGWEGQYFLELTHPSNPDDFVSVVSRRVFNTAGLYADKVSNLLMPSKYKLHYARGHYYSYSAPTSVRHLIYPCPEKNLAGLGTHLTLDLAGKIKFGPDVEYIDDPSDYGMPDEDTKKEHFAKAIRTYLPTLDTKKLQPDYAGIRPKLAGPNEPFRDFVIKEEIEEGHMNFFTLIGIESPGLTSALAIAEHVTRSIH